MAASQTIFDLPTPTLPAIITSPPTAQFTPGPGCVDDPDNNWVVVTSCYAYPLGVTGYMGGQSPDWLTCQVTEFGPPPGQVYETPCGMPVSTVDVEGETKYYTGCPVGYTAVDSSEYTYTYRDRFRTDYYMECCPTQYNLRANGIDGSQTASEREGTTWIGEYPLPRCSAKFIKELSGKEIPVQTAFNTGGWEKKKKRQERTSVPWDYERDTMYAERITFSYTVFDATHTCYGSGCYDWNDYYFSGSPLPSTYTPPSESESGPEPTETGTGTGDVLPPLTETSSTGDDDEPSTTPPPDDSGPTPTTTPTPSPSDNDDNNNGNNLPSPSPSSSPTSAPSEIPKGAGAVLTPSRVVLVLLGLLAASSSSLVMQ